MPVNWAKQLHGDEDCSIVLAWPNRGPSASGTVGLAQIVVAVVDVAVQLCFDIVRLSWSYENS